MSILESLLEEASQSDIDVMDDDMSVPGMHAAYFVTDIGKCIMLRRDGTQAERACWMAEELGHHNTGCNSVLRYKSVADWKAEARARRWAHDRLLSYDAVMVAARNTDDIYEIAFSLDVSVEFLREAMDDYMARGLWQQAAGE